MKYERESRSIESITTSSKGFFHSEIRLHTLLDTQSTLGLVAKAALFNIRGVGTKSMAVPADLIPVRPCANPDCPRKLTLGDKLEARRDADLARVALRLWKSGYLTLNSRPAAPRLDEGPNYELPFDAVLFELIRSRKVLTETIFFFILCFANYLGDSMGNKGAIIRFSREMTPSYVKFTHVEHPPIAPMAYAGNMRSMMGM